MLQKCVFPKFIQRKIRAFPVFPRNLGNNIIYDRDAIVKPKHTQFLFLAFSRDPTVLFSIKKPKNPPIDVSMLHKKLSVDVLWKGLSGSGKNEFPTSPFPIFESPWFDEFQVVQRRRAQDYKAPKLWKGSSGSASQMVRDLRQHENRREVTEANKCIYKIGVYCLFSCRGRYAQLPILIIHTLFLTDGWSQYAPRRKEFSALLDVRRIIFLYI